MSLFIKTPVGVLEYKFDWSNWLATDETISSATITVTTGITKGSDALTDANKSVTVWLSGGTAGTRYTVTCQIATSASRTDSRFIEIEIAERPA